MLMDVHSPPSISKYAIHRAQILSGPLEPGLMKREELCLQATSALDLAFLPQ